MEMKEVEVDISLVDLPEEIDRIIIDPEKVRELAESIREEGQLQAILIRPKDNGRFELVAGHRRILALRILGRMQARAVSREMDEGKAMVLRGIENLQRENLTPIEEARVYQRLKERLSLTKREVAQKVGRNIITVTKYMKLLELPDYIQEAVNKGVLGTQVALVLAEIEDEELQKYYINCAMEHGITVKVAEIWVSDYNATRAGKYYEEGRGVVQQELKIEAKPIYITCFRCHGAEEVMDVSSVQICKECFNEMVLSRKK